MRSRLSLLVGLLGLLALLALSLVPKADGIRLVVGGKRSPQPYQRWANHARMPTTDSTVELIKGYRPMCGTHRNCAAPSPLRIVIMDRSHLWLWHEIGHIFDWVVMGAGDVNDLTSSRRAFLRIRKRRGGWQQGRNPTHEQFAQAFMFCARDPRRLPGRRLPGVYWQYGYRSTSLRQHRRSCRLIRSSWRNYVRTGG